MMEVYAGFLEHTDYHIGRLLDFLKGTGEFDNTLIIALSDNGASSEGGPNGMININLWHNNLPGTTEDNLKVLDELAARSISITMPGVGLLRATLPSGVGNARPIAAASPIRSSCIGAKASRPAMQCEHNTSMSLTWCRPCSIAWASRRPPRFAGDASAHRGYDFRAHL